MKKFVQAVSRLALVPALMAASAGSTAWADGSRIAKDTGPASAACDAFAKATPQWSACVGGASHAMADDELFYAGYWLAKNGQYDRAISYLNMATKKDERVLTYIGFATRKLGRVGDALPLYREALALNPDYVVARAYLGEAFLSLNDPQKAKDELAEIERRCGATCAAYADLKQHIHDFEQAAAKG